MPTTLYIDADACPVKDEAVRVAERHGRAATDPRLLDAERYCSDLYRLRGLSPESQTGYHFSMTSKTRTIELDETTVTALRQRADERGLTVPELVTEYLDEDRGPVDADADQIAELDRRWAAVQAGQATAKHEQVVRWLETWGTPAFKPWRDQ